MVDTLLFSFVPSLKLVHLCSSIAAINLVYCGLLLLNHSSLRCPELSLIIGAFMVPEMWLELSWVRVGSGFPC